MKLTDEQMHLGAHEGTGPDYVDPEVERQDDRHMLRRLTSGIEMFIDVGLNLGKQVEESGRATRRLLDRLEGNTPVDYSTATSGVYPSSGTMMLTFGSPDQGTFWEVESVAVGGGDQNVAIAGTAGLYISGYIPTISGSPGMSSMIDQATSLPNVGFYGGRQCLVQDQESLVLVIFGGTPGTQYIANAQITVYNNAAGRGRVSVVA